MKANGLGMNRTQNKDNILGCSRRVIHPNTQQKTATSTLRSIMSRNSIYIPSYSIDENKQSLTDYIRGKSKNTVRMTNTDLNDNVSLLSDHSRIQKTQQTKTSKNLRKGQQQQCLNDQLQGEAVHSKCMTALTRNRPTNLHQGSYFEKIKNRISVPSANSRPSHFKKNTGSRLQIDTHLQRYQEYDQPEFVEPYQQKNPNKVKNYMNDYLVQENRDGFYTLRQIQNESLGTHQAVSKQETQIKPTRTPSKSFIIKKALKTEQSISKNHCQMGEEIASFSAQKRTEIDLNSPQNLEDISKIISSVHSHRRLTFQRQQELHKRIFNKNETFHYVKNFNLICSNSHIKTALPSSLEIDQILGIGSYASGQAYDTYGKTQQKFAVKVYQKYKLIEASVKNRVKTEIQILCRLIHPNVISMFGALEDKKQIHMIFEYLPNAITLQQYLKNQQKRGTFKSLSKTLTYVTKEVIKGVEYLHSQGIYHRDLKPDNIMLYFPSSNLKSLKQLGVKIIDFGFATQSKVGTSQCGTPNFMARELFMAKGTQYLCEKVDIWAMGVILFYLHEGRYPFRGYNEKDLYRSIRSGKFYFNGEFSNQFIQTLVAKMLDLTPENRPSIKQVLCDLNQFY